MHFPHIVSFSSSLTGNLHFNSSDLDLISIFHPLIARRRSAYNYISSGLDRQKLIPIEILS